MKKFILIIMTLVITAGLEAQNNLEQARQAADTFLKSLTSTVTTDNYKMFGLSSLQEVNQLQADQVFISNIIPLDRLKKYTGGDVTPLLTNVNRASCIIIDRQTQQIVGIVDLERQKESYIVKGFSSSDLSAALGRINKELFKQKFSLVRVPALNVFFGSFTDTNNQMKYVSLQNNSNLQTEIGEIRPAEDFVKRLVPMANAYNGLPW